MRTKVVSRWVMFAFVAVGATGACGDGNKHAKCEAGTESCPCYPNGTCNDGLSCRSDLCVDPGSGSTGGSDTGGASSDGGSATGSKTGTGGVGGSPGTGGKAAGTGGKGGSGGKSSSTGGVGTMGGAGTMGGNGSTPVATHGQLAVVGPDLVDESGAPVKLEGMSSMWLNWDVANYATSKAGLQWMRDNWNLRVFRAAMGVDEKGGYLMDPTGTKAKVNQIVQNAIDLGVYVIIDWHDHNALSHQAEAVAFFTDMATTWGSYPNVIYEVFNEPLAVSWASQLKPYHQALVSAIRAEDPDNVIVLGTPNWDQDVDVAAASPVSGSNLMYTLHFYACTHQAAHRNKAKAARSAGLPMFVTEWGATHADGGLDGIVCDAEARAWHDWMDSTNISWAAWKLDGCTDSSCMFKSQTAPVGGGWTSTHLNGHAPLVIDEMKNDVASGGTSGTGGGAGTGGATGGSFPPDPAGCARVTSCPSCCSTSGVFALNTLDSDVTSSRVTSFAVSSSAVTAQFDFASAGEVGAVFFQFASEQEIGSIGFSMSATAGAREMALVNGGGADGCIYPIVGSSLQTSPTHCWGVGAGPWVGLPANQIEMRIRSTASGPATLTVSSITYSP